MAFLIVITYWYQSEAPSHQTIIHTPSVVNQKEVTTERIVTPVSQPKKTSVPVKRLINHQIKSVPLKISPPAITEKSWKGPKSFSLGEKTITLKSLDWRLHITVILSTDHAHTYRMFAPLRRRMVEMLYFLVSHRVARALKLDTSEERLRDDLSKRFNNLLHNHEFSVDFENYELEKIEDKIDAWEEHPRYEVGKQQADHLRWEENTESRK